MIYSGLGSFISFYIPVIYLISTICGRKIQLNVLGVRYLDILLTPVYKSNSLALGSRE
jgi:hypothetical protein